MKTEWLSNNRFPEDRSGVARFGCGALEVEIPLQDSSHFFALMSVLTAVDAMAVTRTAENARQLAITALNRLPK